MKLLHMHPEEAVFTYLDLSTKYFLWLIILTSDEAFNAASLELRQAMTKHNIDENKFIIAEKGEFFLFDKNDL